MKKPYKFKKSLVKLALLPFALGTALSIQAATPSVELWDCYAKNLSDRAQCGKISQPLSEGKAEQKIDIHFMVIPAIKPLYPQEAVLAFAGGPGQSATEIAANFESILKYARESRDIILVDQRGTGKSNLLQCDIDELAQQFALDDSLVGLEFYQDDARDCKNKLDTDLSDYTTVAAAKDFDAVRAALGYSKLHLYGGSYGTRIALEYMRQFPQSVASAVLDGLAPNNQSLMAIGGAIEGSLNALFEQCQADTHCAGAYPNLSRQWQSLLEQVDKTPITVPVKHPRTNQPLTMKLTKMKLFSAIRMALYSHTSRVLVPLAISEAAKGNVLPLVGLMAPSEEGMGLALGMHQAIVCGEDWPRLTASDKAKYSDNYMGKMMIEGLDATCPIWDVKPVPPSYYEAVESDIPTLLLSGGLDPATPAKWAEVAMEKLSNATHLIAPTATHIVASQSCANKLIAKFYDEKAIGDFDTSCLDEDTRKQFFMNINGPATATEKE
ncbi:alpha/beta fold hydrolase [Pseudoalteromonas piscicida]|uniref:Alpha/beta hydrolase n=1 Tax=Pseudoalteromonas piscicida TaxID=43662 RepID=A0A2A5JR18_PSEO7|nr:alpha/beta fold hydrolase [Pseudoalteromonas piscicida]PCK31840.1 alpha/beta hydrolase [Pseudoalteromonas piscicida]